MMAYISDEELVPYEVYLTICELLDNHDLIERAGLAVLTSAIYYIYPTMDMKPKEIGDTIAQFIERCEKRKEEGKEV